MLAMLESLRLHILQPHHSKARSVPAAARLSSACSSYHQYAHQLSSTTLIRCLAVLTTADIATVALAASRSPSTYPSRPIAIRSAKPQHLHSSIDPLLPPPTVLRPTAIPTRPKGDPIAIDYSLPTSNALAHLLADIVPSGRHHFNHDSANGRPALHASTKIVRAISSAQSACRST